MANYLIYTPIPNDWLSFTTELAKLGKVSTDKLHAVSLETTASLSEIEVVIGEKLVGHHYVVVEAKDSIYGGPAAVRNLVEHLR
ncbi:hypothetical protein [Bosea sp. NPDC055594]